MHTLIPLPAPLMTKPTAPQTMTVASERAHALIVLHRNKSHVLTDDAGIHGYVRMPLMLRQYFYMNGTAFVDNWPHLL